MSSRHLCLCQENPTSLPQTPKLKTTALRFSFNTHLATHCEFHSSSVRCLWYASLLLQSQVHSPRLVDPSTWLSWGTPHSSSSYISLTGRFPKCYTAPMLKTLQMAFHYQPNLTPLSSVFGPTQFGPPLPPVPTNSHQEALVLTRQVSALSYELLSSFPLPCLLLCSAHWTSLSCCYSRAAAHSLELSILYEIYLDYFLSQLFAFISKNTSSRLQELTANLNFL